MRKVVLHTGDESSADRRLFENASLLPAERMKKAFELMQLAALFKKGVIKLPQGLGVVLKKVKR